MNNTVLVESKIRQKLKLACALMCVICLFFIAFVVVTVMIDRQNLNGQTDEVTGVLNEAYVDDTNTLTLESKSYNAVWDIKNVNIDEYVGNTVTLVITRDTFASSNPWALGLIVDNQTVVDYRVTLEAKKTENKELKTVFIAVTSVMCVATCGLFIWRFNVQPAVERELYKEFGEFLSARQPTCPQRKFLVIYVSVYVALLFALLFTAIFIDPDAETIPELPAAAKAVLWTLLAVGIAGIAGAFALNAWIARKEIDFYAEKLPFDFSDISHARLRKKVKEELQQEILKDYAEHPDTYADGGNGYDVTFGEKGVTLTVPFEHDEQVETMQPIAMPDANDVFGETVQIDASNDAPADLNSNSGKNALFFKYDELKFEAVAHFRRNVRPMMIIIKSRLTRTDDFPEEFVNDIHIAFDLNLLKTFDKFGVEVENLKYLMDNKKRLMTENCLVLHKNKEKISK